MNILFLIFHGLSAVSGISKKILSQLEGLRLSGHQVSLCHYEVHEDGHRVRMINDDTLQDYGNSKLAPLKKRTCYRAIISYALQHQIQLVYVRSFHNANPFTIRLFRQLQHIGIRIVMEIPTYPYDQEYRLLPFSWKIELGIDQCFRHRLAHYTDGIVTFSDEKQIFGQHTICISNGVDFNRIPLKKDSGKQAEAIHLLGVAEVHYWHGYDRIIAGLGEYYKQQPKRTVNLHIVGGIGAAEKATFTELIEKYQLQQHIFFYGQKQGEELDELFEKCQFAVGSLGRHRSGIQKIKTLKNREYAARGIPFIYSETDEDFENMPYVMKAPADESPVDVQAILIFYDSQTYTPQQIRNTIRHLSWQEQMQKVIGQTFNS